MKALFIILSIPFLIVSCGTGGSSSGKFRVGILKQDERGINQYSATITTDCNCKVIDAGGITSH